MIYALIASREEGVQLPATVGLLCASVEPVRTLILEDEHGVGPSRCKESLWLRASGTLANDWAAEDNDIVVFCDAHIRPPYEWTRKLREAFDALGDKAVVSFPVAPFTEAAKIPVLYGMQANSVMGKFDSPWHGIRARELYPHVPAPMGAMVAAKASWWRAIGGYAPGLVGYGLEEQFVAWRTWGLGGSVHTIRTMPVPHLFRQEGREGGRFENTKETNVLNRWTIINSILPQHAEKYRRIFEGQGFKLETVPGLEEVPIVEDKIRTWCGFRHPWEQRSLGTARGKRREATAATAARMKEPEIEGREGVRFLVVMPTRGRPKQAFEALLQYDRLRAGPHKVKFLVVADADDATMMGAEQWQKSLDAPLRVVRGAHKNKIEAINGSLHYVGSDYDILIVAADDQLPEHPGWDVEIAGAMLRRWPAFDGALHLNDGFTGEHLCTQHIIGRRLVEKMGYLYHPDYESFFADNDYTEELKLNGRLYYIDHVVIRHHHPAWGLRAPDETYARYGADAWSRDKAVYDGRKAGLKWFPPVLSVLIASLEERKKSLAALTDHLYEMIYAYGAMCLVEVLVDVDRRSLSTGAKRNRLLDRASGNYCCFIDDDDWVPSDWVERVLTALRTQAPPDCLSLTGTITTDGKNPRTFKHSIEYEGWYEREGVYYRSPNHCNVVRTELARQAGFPDLTHGEDQAFSERLRPLLKTEAELPGVMYEYRHRSQK